MAFPSVVATAEPVLTTAATSFTMTFTQTTDDLVVAFMALPSAQSITSITNGFTQLTSGSSRHHVFYKKLLGGEGGSFTVSYGTSARACGITRNITGYELTRAPTISSIATATSASPNAQNCDPGRTGDYLWLTGFAQAGEEADDDTWCTAVPSGFSSLAQKTTGVAGVAAGNCSIANAAQQLNASSLDAGSFTTVQSLAWHAHTVAIWPYELPATAFAMKVSFHSSFVRKNQRPLEIHEYPQTYVPPEEEFVTPHFFILPTRRYHKSGRFQ